MSKMQIKSYSKDGKNGSTRTKATLVLSLLSALLCITLVAGQSVEALKVIVYFKYSEWHKDHPKQIGKIDLYVTSDTDTYRKNLKASFMDDLPKKKSINLDVPVNGEFIVHLNSGPRDEGYQKSGVNGPEKSPEKVKVRVP